MQLMRTLPELFDNNRKWAAGIIQNDPYFFKKLSQQQSPRFLWIGCSDSRVPSNQIVGLLPGELFVHRNVANLIIHSDMNCLSVIQYAVEVLKIKHIIVCGHYGCGGIRAAMGNRCNGPIDSWLDHIRNTHQKHYDELMVIAEEEKRIDRLCELNVAEQVKNLGNISIVQNAWLSGQPLVLHSWIYNISDGLLNDLGFSITSAAEMRELEKK